MPTLQLGHHALQAFDFGFQLGDVPRGERFHFAAGALRVVLQAQKLPDLRQRKAHFPRMADKAQPGKVGLAVAAVARFAARGRGEQAVLFVVADLLGGKAAFGGLMRNPCAATEGCRIGYLKVSGGPANKTNSTNRIMIQ